MLAAGNKKTMSNIKYISLLLLLIMVFSVVFSSNVAAIELKTSDDQNIIKNDPGKTTSEATINIDYYDTDINRGSDSSIYYEKVYRSDGGDLKVVDTKDTQTKDEGENPIIVDPKDAQIISDAEDQKVDDIKDSEMKSSETEEIILIDPPKETVDTGDDDLFEPVDMDTGPVEDPVKVELNPNTPPSGTVDADGDEDQQTEDGPTLPPPDDQDSDGTSTTPPPDDGDEEDSDLLLTGTRGGDGDDEMAASTDGEGDENPEGPAGTGDEEEVEEETSEEEPVEEDGPDDDENELDDSGQNIDDDFSVYDDGEPAISNTGIYNDDLNENENQDVDEALTAEQDPVIFENQNNDKKNKGGTKIGGSPHFISPNLIEGKEFNSAFVFGSYVYSIIVIVGLIALSIFLIKDKFIYREEELIKENLKKKEKINKSIPKEFIL